MSLGSELDEEEEVKEFAEACDETRQAVIVLNDAQKGRKLQGLEFMESGSEILFEYPLVETSSQCNEELFAKLLDLVGGPDEGDKATMYWGAFHSLTRNDWGEHARPACDCGSSESTSNELQASLLILHQSQTDDELTKKVVDLLELPESTHKLFHSLYQIWVGNAFDASEPDIPYCGALYYLPSMVNHSCRPTCSWSMIEDNSYILRARRDVEEGEELTISYLNEEQMKWPTAARRQFLLDTKDFICACDRCLNIDSMRTFSCDSCEEGKVAPIQNLKTEENKENEEQMAHKSRIVDYAFECNSCGLQWSEQEAQEREKIALTDPDRAEDLLGPLHYLAEQSWPSKTVPGLEKRLSFLRHHELHVSGEFPKVLEDLGDLRADPSREGFDLRKAAENFEEASNLFGNLFGTDSDAHQWTRKKHSCALKDLQDFQKGAGKFHLFEHKVLPMNGRDETGKKAHGKKTPNARKLRKR